MTRRRWLAIGLGMYVVALIVHAPATLLDARLRDASDGRLRLAEARGTAWSGTGQLELRDARDRTGVAKHVAWRLRPSALLRAQLGYQIELDQGPGSFPVALSWSGIELQNAEINLPAAALGYVVPKLAPLGLTGQMRLQIPQLAVDRRATRGGATLHWQAAGSALTPVSPLGAYELRFEGDGADVSVALRTVEGPLQLHGKGSWATGRAPSFLATAQVPAELQQQLAPLLRLIAVERGDGSFELQIK